MTEPTADAPNVPETDAPSPAHRRDCSHGRAGGRAAGRPRRRPHATIIVLTEEALKPVDVDKIVGLHEDDAPTYRVLVPADTERNLLSSFLNT